MSAGRESLFLLRDQGSKNSACDNPKCDNPYCGDDAIGTNSSGQWCLRHMYDENGESE